MTRRRPYLIALLATAAWALPAAAQGTPPGFREEILGQLESSTGKLIALAEAMPAERFAWGPTPEVMPVGQVYMHVAAYNYYYPKEGMGVAVPAGIDPETMESLRDKEVVVDQLKRSVEHLMRTVRETPEAQLAAPTRLYGREVAQWAVLLQLLAHMNEHLGQSISYARVAGVVPPWSR